MKIKSVIVTDLELARPVDYEVSMNFLERRVIALVLLFMFVLTATDLVSDSKSSDFTFSHVLLEGAIGIISLIGFFILMRGTFTLRHQLQVERKVFSDFRKEAEVWRSESKKIIQGLSLAIDKQLDKWGLTSAEKEVAFLLLKGMSLKEVAEVRGTSEKTARAQSLSIYSKSGLSGRSELSAYFLEDLLAPIAPETIENL